jgi:RNA polymerase sigma-B factor
VNAAPVLTQHDDTHDLIEAARHADAAERALLEDEVVRRHLGLAHHLAARYGGRGADRDDLAQVACFALVKAIRGFDHERGEFVPFATVTILGEIKKYFRDYCWGIRPPRRIQQMQADISSATERCLQSESRQPDMETIANEIDARVDEVREAMAARSCFSPTSLDQPVRESGRPLGETIAGETSDYDFIDEWVTIEPLCRDLDDEERLLLRLRFVEDKTQQEIAEIVGVSQMQISRRLAKLLARLRESAMAVDAA